MARLPRQSPTVSAYLRTLHQERGQAAVDHAIEVSRWTMLIAEELGTPLADADRMREAAIVLEIERALGNRDDLTSARGRAILDTEQQAWARAHTERWDGSGPNGLKGEDIPIEGRVIALACRWAQVMRDEALDAGSAVAALWQSSGRQFCPESVRALTRLRALKET